MEAFLLFLLVAGGLLLAGTIFTVWVIVAGARGIARMVTGNRNRPQIPHISQIQICNNVQCQCQNPSYARFCRRCGKSLPNLLRVVPSRVAML